MTINKIDDISFKLNKQHDFSWLKKWGKTAVEKLPEEEEPCRK